MKPIKNSRIMTGTRPTSPDIHFGHILGYINPLIELQKDNELFLLIADQHAITDITGKESLDLRLNALMTVKSWLAAGIKPEKAIIYIQSGIPETSELAQILSCFVSKAEIDRNPVFKDKQQMSAALWYYPVLQAADIAVVKGEYVPVGIDQKPHLEKSQIMIRNFNKNYGSILVVPEEIIQAEVVLPGIDGKKMSSSADNYISPSMDDETLLGKIKKVKTLKMKPEEKVNTPECNVYALYSTVPEFQGSAYQDCQGGKTCFDCKKTLAEAISDEYAGFRERMAGLSDDQVIELLMQGTSRAREVAREILAKVKDAVGMRYF